MSFLRNLLMAMISLLSLSQLLQVAAFPLNSTSLTHDFHKKRWWSHVALHMGDVFPHDRIGRGGSVPSIELWDEDGREISRIARRILFKNTKAGEFHEYGIKNNKGRKGTYLGLGQYKGNAVCIALASVRNPDETKYYFTGDAAYLCNGDWYHSNVYVEPYALQPRCMWLDRNHGDGKYGGVGIHMPDFVYTPERVRQYMEHPKSLCESTPRLQLYRDFDLKTDSHSFFDPVLEYRSGTWEDVDLSLVEGQEGTPHAHYQPPFQKLGMRTMIDRQDIIWGMDHFRKRDNVTMHKGRPRQYHLSHKRHLISSDNPKHTASELCMDDNSSGPDFVSLVEQAWCDMSTKELWPLCNDQADIKHACFDFEQKEMRPATGGIGRRDTLTGREVPTHKSYLYENAWREEGTTKYGLHPELGWLASTDARYHYPDQEQPKDGDPS